MLIVQHTYHSVSTLLSAATNNAVPHEWLFNFQYQLISRCSNPLELFLYETVLLWCHAAQLLKKQNSLRQILFMLIFIFNIITITMSFIFNISFVFVWNSRPSTNSWQIECIDINISPDENSDQSRMQNEAKSLLWWAGH